MAPKRRTDNPTSESAGEPDKSIRATSLTRSKSKKQ